MKNKLDRTYPGSDQAPIPVGGHVGQAGLDEPGHVEAGRCLVDADEGCQLPDRPGSSGHRTQHVVPRPAREGEGHGDRVRSKVHLDGFASILHRGHAFLRGMLASGFVPGPGRPGACEG